MQVLKDDGDTVEKGDLLVRLDDTAFRQSLNSAQEAERVAQQSFDQDKAVKMEEKLRKAQFTFEDFAAQLKEVRKMGPVGQLLGMIPGFSGPPATRSTCAARPRLSNAASFFGASWLQALPASP